MEHEKVAAWLHRTKKEKRYLALVVFFSLLIWSFLIFSIYRQLVSVNQEKDLTQQCYVHDAYTNTITATNEKYLIDFVGEECIRWEDLTEEEKRRLEAAEEDVVEKVFSSITTPVYVLLFFDIFCTLIYTS